MLGGSFIFVMCPNTHRVLLGLRSVDAEFSPNTWAMFGGTNEVGETAFDTATREFKEETQRDIFSNAYLNNHPIKFIEDDNGDDHHIAIFFASCDDEFDININKEHQAYEWVDVDDMMNRALHPFVIRLFSTNEYFKRFMSMYNIDIDEGGVTKPLTENIDVDPEFGEEKLNELLKEDRINTLEEDNLAQQEEMEKHKWIESEKAGRDLGTDAIIKWIRLYAPKWRKIREDIRLNRIRKILRGELSRDESR